MNSPQRRFWVLEQIRLLSSSGLRNQVENHTIGGTDEVKQMDSGIGRAGIA